GLEDHRDRHGWMLATDLEEELTLFSGEHERIADRPGGGEQRFEPALAAERCGIDEDLDIPASHFETSGETLGALLPQNSHDFVGLGVTRRGRTSSRLHRRSCWGARAHHLALQLKTEPPRLAYEPPRDGLLRHH